MGGVESERVGVGVWRGGMYLNLMNNQLVVDCAANINFPHVSSNQNIFKLTITTSSSVGVYRARHFSVTT